MKARGAWLRSPSEAGTAGQGIALNRAVTDLRKGLARLRRVKDEGPGHEGALGPFCTYIAPMSPIRR